MASLPRIKVKASDVADSAAILPSRKPRERDAVSVSRQVPGSRAIGSRKFHWSGIRVDQELREPTALRGGYRGQVAWRVTTSRRLTAAKSFPESLTEPLKFL